MPDNIPQIPISFGLDPKDAQILSQIAKDIEVIVKALDKLGSKRVIDERDAKEAKTLVDRIEQLKKKQAEATGYVEKMRLEQKRLRLEMEAAERSALPGIRKQLQGVNAELQKATATTNTWGTALGSFQFKFNALGNIVAGITAALSIGMMNALRSVTQAVVQFEKSFAAARGIMSAQDVQMFGEQLEKASIDTMVKYGLSIEDVNRALYDALSSQVKAADAAMVLEASAKLATAGLTTMDAAMKGIVSIINAYSMEMTEADRVGTIFFQSQIDAIATIDEMVNAFGRMNTVASISGASIEEVAASFSAITLTGLDADEAVTGIRNIFSELLSPAEQSKKALTSIGLAYGATGLRAQGFNGTLTALNKAFKEQPNVVNEIFGNIRGLTAVYGLLGERFDEFQGIYQKVLDGYQSGINYEKGLQDQLDTTVKKVEQLQAAWSALWINLDNGKGIFSELVKAVLEGTTLMLQGLSGGNGPGEITFFGEAEGKEQANAFFNNIKEAIDKGQFTVTEAMMSAAKRMNLAYQEMLKQADNPDMKAETEAYYNELVRLYTEVFANAVAEGTGDVIPLNERLIADLEIQKGKLEDSLKGLKANDFVRRDEIMKEINEIQAILDAFYGKVAKDSKKAKDTQTQELIRSIREEYELRRMAVELQEETAGREIELKRLTAEESIKLAEAEYDGRKRLGTATEQDAENLQRFITLTWAKYAKERLLIEKQYGEKASQETYDFFKQEQEIALASNESYLVEYENQLKASGKETEEISFEVNKKRLEFTLAWAEEELRIVTALYGEESTQARLLLAEINKMKAEIAAPPPATDGATGKSLIGRLFGMSDEEADQVIQSLYEIRDAALEITDVLVEAAEQRVRAIEDEIDASERREDELEADMNHEWERMQAGYANNYDLKQKQLADERKRQQQLERDREKALEKEVKMKNIQIGISQSVAAAELLAAAAKAISSTASIPFVGVVLGLAAAASLVAGYLAIQSNIESIKYAKGGYFELDGPSHDQGGIDIGGGREAEGGEGVSIYSRSATKKYNKEIKDFTKAANSGQLLTGWSALSSQLGNQPLPSTSIMLNDEYSRKIYELQKAHFGKEDVKVVQLSPTRTMIIMDGGRYVKYVNHPANADS